MKDGTYTFCIYCGFAMFQKSKNYYIKNCKGKECYNYTIYTGNKRNTHSIYIENYIVQNDYESKSCIILRSNGNDSPDRDCSLLHEFPEILDFSDIEKLKEIINNVLLLS